MNPYRIDSIRSPHVRESKTVLDSGYHAVDSGFQVLDSGFFLSVELGFLIPIFSGIPDSLSCIPDSAAQDSAFQVLDSGFFVSGTWISLVGFRILSGLHKQKFPGFWNP